MVLLDCTPLLLVFTTALVRPGVSIVNMVQWKIVCYKKMKTA